MRKQLQNRYLTLETRKDGTKFTSRGLREAAESLQSISRSYSEKQAQLVDEVRGQQLGQSELVCWQVCALPAQSLQAPGTYSGKQAHLMDAMRCQQLWMFQAGVSAALCLWLSACRLILEGQGSCA